MCRSSAPNAQGSGFNKQGPHMLRRSLGPSLTRNVRIRAHSLSQAAGLRVEQLLLARQQVPRLQGLRVSLGVHGLWAAGHGRAEQRTRGGRGEFSTSLWVHEQS